MEERDWLSRYAALGLGVAGGFEWFLGWTISRMAAAPTLEGTPRAIVETLGRFGLFFLAPCYILAAFLIITSAVRFGATASAEGAYEKLALSIFLSLMVVVSTFLSVGSNEAWIGATFNLLAWTSLMWVAVRFALDRTASWSARGAALLTAAAYSAWYYYVIEQSVFAGSGSSGGAPSLVLDLGELAALLTPVLLFAAIAVPHSQWRVARRWILPVAMGLLFGAGNVADMAAGMGFAGVFAKWSLGFSLYLPWPLYAVSLALFVYSLLTCLAGGSKSSFANANTAFGLVLLLYAGYNLQLTYQHLVALLALLLFTVVSQPFARRVATVERPAYTLDLPETTGGASEGATSKP